MSHKYTAKEIDSNINILLNDRDILLRKRKALNLKFKYNREQLKYWEEFDLSQLKII